MFQPRTVKSKQLNRCCRRAAGKCLRKTQISYEMRVNFKLSGGEDHYTMFLILQVNIMLYSKLHYQKVLN